MTTATKAYSYGSATGLVDKPVVDNPVLWHRMYCIVCHHHHHAHCQHPCLNSNLWNTHILNNNYYVTAGRIYFRSKIGRRLFDFDRPLLNLKHRFPCPARCANQRQKKSKKKIIQVLVFIWSRIDNNTVCLFPIFSPGRSLRAWRLGWLNDL